jgi:hypothetical protein
MTKQFRGLLFEMINSLYIHAASKDDIKKEVD